MRRYNKANSPVILTTMFITGCKSSELPKNDLKEITGEDFKEVPEFQVLENGINLFIESEKGEDRYTHLNYKDLMRFLTLKEIVDGR